MLNIKPPVHSYCGVLFRIETSYVKILHTPPYTHTPHPPTHHLPEQFEEAVFQCSALFQLHCWNHVAVVVNRDSVLRDKVLRGKPKATLFVNGQLVGTKKVGI